MTWEAIEALSDDALERQLYGPRAGEVPEQRPEPDLAWIHRELRRPGVTLELLHVEFQVTWDSLDGRGRNWCRCPRKSTADTGEIDGLRSISMGRTGSLR